LETLSPPRGEESTVFVEERSDLLANRLEGAIFSVVSLCLLKLQLQEVGLIVSATYIKFVGKASPDELHIPKAFYLEISPLRGALQSGCDFEAGELSIENISYLIPPINISEYIPVERTSGGLEAHSGSNFRDGYFVAV
jgi:hypothetical protein